MDGSSLLSFICPRAPSLGLVDGFRLSSINCNLLSDFNSCDVDLVPCNELMKVYLRIRPFPSSAPSLSCKNNYTVVMTPPDEGAQKNNWRLLQKSAHKFTFSRVFDSSVGQETIFSAVAVEHIRSFLEGLNGLIFGYGTTSSGKTYTMQGTINQMGLIPRALYTIFSTVRHTSDPKFMPKDFSDVISLTPEVYAKINDEKAVVLKLAQCVPQESDEMLNHDKGGLVDFFRIPESQTTPMPFSDHKLDQCLRSLDDLCFTFWISFAEIYNEVFYDLLDPAQCTATLAAPSSSSNTRPGTSQYGNKNVFSAGGFQSNQLRRTPLDLRTDKNGNIFIKGVRWFPITSPIEALKLLWVGRQCQKMAATRLNQSSSRSHSIFFIRAIRVVDKENPRFARVSSLLFCDLAGSERSEKAGTGGQMMRIREAGNINTSLLTLGRCIECLRYNQLHPENPRLVPYRDSKLTRLFQGFFTGQGKACMIVNASPNPDLYDETIHALRFSALAKGIIVEPNSIIDTTIIQPHGPTSGQDAKRLMAGASKKNIVRSVASKSVERTPATPATVVRNNKARQPKTPATVKQWDPIRKDDETLVGDDDTDASSIESDLNRTPTDNDGTELFLDHYNKEELIGMVKDLSEQLFETKGQLLEQEVRLREEMCENMNRQLIEYEKNIEEFVKMRDKASEEESKRRMQEFIDRVNKRQARLHMKNKRPCPDDSELSSDDDLSTLDDTMLLPSNELKNAEHHELPDKREQGPCPRCKEQSLLAAQASESLKEAQDRLADLEGDLADQKDVIENLLRERDQNRMEITRLEFMATQQSSQPSYQTRKSTLPSSPRPSEDVSIIINMPNSKPGPDTSTCSRRFFDPISDSPEQQQRLAAKLGDESQNLCQTPPTVIKAGKQVSEKANQNGDGLVQKLRQENQALLVRLNQLRTNVQQAIQQKQEAESELAQLRRSNDSPDARESRLSEGLQSFLEHESRLLHQETMDQLKQQVYDLEEQFAHKHDALVQLESSYESLKNEFEDASQRVLSQANELRRLNQQVSSMQAAHQDELETAIEKTRHELQQEIDRLNRLHPNILTIPTGVQTSNLELDSKQTQTQDHLTCVSNSSVQTTPSHCATTGAQTSPLVDRHLTHNVPSLTKVDDPPPDQNSKPAKGRLRIRRMGRLTQRILTTRLPRIPSPATLTVYTSDSDMEPNSTLKLDDEKENQPNDTDADDDDGDDSRSCVSEPVGSPTQKRSTGRSRTTRSETSSDNENVTVESKPNKRVTRASRAARRLPPLAESTQLLPDSYFQDELDQALEKTDAELKRQERQNMRQLNLRQQPRRRR